MALFKRLELEGLVATGARQQLAIARFLERRLVAVTAALATLYGLGLLGAALLPILLRDYPLLLITLQSTSGVLLLVSAQIDLIPFLTVATLRRFISHFLFYLLGRWYGERAIRWMEGRNGRAHGLVQAMDRLFAHIGRPIVLVFPSTVAGVLAGSARMPRWQFIALDLAGTLCSVLVVRFAATAVSGPMATVVRSIDRNAGWLTVIFVLATLLWLVAERLRGRTVGAAIGDLTPSSSAATERRGAIPRPDARTRPTQD